MKNRKVGVIIVPGDVNVWPHEYETAKVLATNGFDVKFIRKSNRFRERSADAYVDGKKWEFKSPTAKHTRTILKNLKEAEQQAERVILDSRRMKKVPDVAILREIRKQIPMAQGLKSIKYISKAGKIVDIK